MAWLYPFGFKTAEAIDRYKRVRRQHRCAREEALWLALCGPMTTSGLSQMPRKRGAAAGIEGLHPHKFRHAFAHRWLANEGNEGDLQALAGWSRSLIQRSAWRLGCEALRSLRWSSIAAARRGGVKKIAMQLSPRALAWRNPMSGRRMLVLLIRTMINRKSTLHSVNGSLNPGPDGTPFVRIGDAVPRAELPGTNVEVLCRRNGGVIADFRALAQVAVTVADPAQHEPEIFRHA